jgi:Putative adhesin
VTQWRIDTPQSLDLEGVRRLNVRMVAGSIDVVGSSEAAVTGGAHLEVSKLDGALTVTLEGDTLTIAHEKLTWTGLLDWVGNHKASAVISVSVPDACPVELGVVSAEAVVSGITADTKVKSVSGNVTLDGVNADISAQTVSGDLETRHLEGKLRFTTVSGDLTVVDGSSSQVKAETVSGDITLDLDVASGARLDLNSVSGDVTLRLPESANLQVEVKTMSGSLDSAFSGVTRDGKPGRSTLRGNIGTGDGLLQAKTVSGDVTLLRRPAA